MRQGHPWWSVIQMWVRTRTAPVQTRGGLGKEGGPVPNLNETHLRPPRCTAQRATEQFINSATFPIKKVDKIKICVLVAARVCREQKL